MVFFIFAFVFSVVITLLNIRCFDFSFLKKSISFCVAILLYFAVILFASLFLISIYVDSNIPVYVELGYMLPLLYLLVLYMGVQEMSGRLSLADLILTFIFLFIFMLLLNFFLYVDFSLIYGVSISRLVFAVFFSLTCFFCLYRLHLFLRNAKSYIFKVKVANFAIVLLPLGTLLIISAFLGFEKFMGMFLIFVACLNMVLSVNMSSKFVVDISFYLPWTKKGRRLMRIMRPFWLLKDDPVMVKDKSVEYEDSLYELAGCIFDKQKEAAGWLGVSEARFSRYKNKKKYQILSDNTAL